MKDRERLHTGMRIHSPQAQAPKMPGPQRLVLLTPLHIVAGLQGLDAPEQTHPRDPGVTRADSIPAMTTGIRSLTS